MKYATNPIVTAWGDYDIAVRTSANTTKRIVGAVASSYKIYRAGTFLAGGTVPAAYATAAVAAESALRIAKLDARESLQGPFPAY